MGAENDTSLCSKSLFRVAFVTYVSCHICEEDDLIKVENISLCAECTVQQSHTRDNLEGFFCQGRINFAICYVTLMDIK